jgi:hypothetical protein
VCGGLAQTGGPRKKTASNQHATRQREPSKRNLARQSLERDDQHQLATLQHVNAWQQQSIGELQPSIGALQQRRATRNTTPTACTRKSAYSHAGLKPVSWKLLCVSASLWPVTNGGLNRKTLNRN